MAAASVGQGRPRPAAIPYLLNSPYPKPQRGHIKGVGSCEPTPFCRQTIDQKRILAPTVKARPNRSNASPVSRPVGVPNGVPGR